MYNLFINAILGFTDKPLIFAYDIYIKIIRKEIFIQKITEKDKLNFEML